MNSHDWINMTNELGFTKDDIRQWIIEVIQDEVKNVDDEKKALELYTTNLDMVVSVVEADATTSIKSLLTKHFHDIDKIWV